MTQHTPGPWEVRTGEFIKDSEGKAIAYCQSSNGTRNVDEVHANARLIAAAPDLLKALDKTAGRIDNLLDSAHFNDTVRNFLMNMGDDIQAAIAKARP